jgi:hypothetical protein
VLHSNCGGEHLGKVFTLHLKSHRLTAHEHASVAEHRSRLIVECIRALLHASGLPRRLWAEAARHFVWLLNRTEASAVDGMTSHEAVFGRKPNLQSVCQCVCVFVCAVKPVKQVGGEAPRRGEKGHTQDEKGE